MADSLPDLVARLRATTPALADVPDDILTAEVARQLQARGGPSVGEAIGLPTFRTSNEKDPSGAAVVRADAVSPWTKAATIGAPGIGDRYPLASVGEILASANPLKLLAEYVTGPGRPRSVQAADPTGIDAFTAGKGPMPMFLGTTEEVGNVLGAAVGDVLGEAGRGLYSRVDDAVSRLPAKGAHPNKIATLLKSNGATAEELAYRQVPEFLASQGNATVTPGALQAHLDAHPAPLPVVKTLAASGLPEGGGLSQFLSQTNEPHPNTPNGWVDLSERLGRRAQQWQRTGDAAQANRFFTMSEEAISMAEGLDHGSTAGQPKYAQYQLPGGEQYKETLLTLPKPKEPANFELQQAFTDANQNLNAFRQANPDAELEGLANPEYRQLVMARNRLGETLTASENAHVANLYRSSHFDEPNILVHTRSNTRTLPTGERGRFVEEVQSDWHQAGKDRGYQGGDLAALREDAASLRERFGNGYGPGVRDVRGNVDPVRHQALQAELRAKDAVLQQAERAVPDAPFKETWPDLGLKQQLLEAAKDPNAQWLGFTSGQTQAARYDLSKQISRVEFDAGDRQLRAFDHSGREVIHQTTGPEDLPDYIGKEAAQKLLASTPSRHPTDQTPLYSLSGVDLQVGGEGMRHFYDELLPKRLQKIVKPFGGTVERVPMAGRSVAAIDAEMDVIESNLDATTADSRRYETLQAERNRARAGADGAPAWIVRLTPAMKARILKEGLPLGLLLGAAAGPSVAEALGSANSAHDQE